MTRKSMLHPMRRVCRRIGPAVLAHKRSSLLGAGASPCPMSCAVLRTVTDALNQSRHDGLQCQRASLRGHPAQGLCKAHLDRGKQAREPQAHLVLTDGLGRERCQQGAGQLTLTVLAVHGQLHSLPRMAGQLRTAACKILS